MFGSAKYGVCAFAGLACELWHFEQYWLVNACRW